MALLLDSDEIERILTPELCLIALEKVFGQMGQGDAVNMHSREVVLSRIRDKEYPGARPGHAYHGLEVQTGAAPRMKTASLRVKSDVLFWPEVDGGYRRKKYPAAADGLYCGFVILFDTDTGEPTALMPDGLIQRMRVGATSALGTKYMSREDASVAAIIGAGWQAEAQVLTLVQVRELDEIRIYSPTRKSREDLANRLATLIKPRVYPVASAEEAVAGADIVHAATNSRAPVLDAGWLAPGAHVSVISVQEIGEELLTLASLVGTSRQHSPKLSNTVIADGFAEDSHEDEFSAGWWHNKSHWDQMVSLGDLINGRASGRTSSEEVTAYITMGAAVRDGGMSALELVSRHVARALSVGKALNCFIHVLADEALRSAESLERRAASGDLVGPLHGVPVTVKDNVVVAGAPTTAGSLLTPRLVSDADAAAVRLLKRAGAVIIGKTNLSEYAFGSTHEAFGEVLNPWDPNLATGGSSSGSAAALAAGIGYGSIGTDTGGSIRIPSSMCGLVGLKPTFGSVGLDGVVTISKELDHVGPLGRTVKDVSLLFSVLTGRSAGADVQPAPRGEGRTRLRLGVLSESDLQGVHPDSASAVDSARGALRDAGHEERVVVLPDRGLARTTMWTLAAADLLGDLRPHLGSPALGDGLRDALQRASRTSAETYEEARRMRDKLTEELDALFAEVDVILTPGVPIPAHGVSERAALRDVRQAYTPLFNLTGHPALIVPAGLSHDGLPLGVQLVGRRHEDHVILGLGQDIETALGSLWTRPDVTARVADSIGRLVS